MVSNPLNNIGFGKRVKLIKCCIQVKAHYTWVIGPSPRLPSGYVHMNGPMGWLCDKLSRPNNITLAISMEHRELLLPFKVNWAIKYSPVPDIALQLDETKTKKSWWVDILMGYCRENQCRKVIQAMGFNWVL